MSPTRPWALVASCVLFGLAPMTRAEAQTVEGRVWDAQSDRTLANAVLRLVDSDGDSRAATTADSTGHYRISIPGPGRYRVQAEHLGYRPYQSGELTFEDGEEVRSLVIEMQPAPVPVRGLEVSAAQADRKLRGFLGTDLSLLRIRPVRFSTLQTYAARGYNLPSMVVDLQIPSLRVLATREGPCYQFRNRGCMPVYLDGARLSRSTPGGLPLEMMGTVVILLPNELVAYPEGAVHVYTIGFLR